MKVAVITANYNNYEILKPVVPQKDVDVEWIYVSDHRPSDLLGWSIQQDVHWGKDPRLAAKFPKVRPWDYTDAPISVWIDASFKIISETAIKELVYFVTSKTANIAQFNHPVRNCIYEEALVVKEHRRYAKNLPIEEQVEYYWDEGHPEHWGLWATGVIVRLHTQQMKKLGQLWLDEITNWTTCDQLSQPYVMRNLGIRPATIPGMYHTGQNPWFEYQASAFHK